MKEVFGYSFALDFLFAELGKTKLWRQKILKKRAPDSPDGVQIGCQIMKKIKLLGKEIQFTYYHLFTIHAF